MSASRRIGIVRARHARSTARLWWVGATLLAGSFAVSTAITTAHLDEPSPTTLPPVTTLPSTTGPPPSSGGPAPTTTPSSPTAMTGTGPPGPQGPQGLPGSPGRPSAAPVTPAPTTTGPPPTTGTTTTTTVGVTATTRCRVPQSTVNPSPTLPIQVSAAGRGASATGSLSTAAPDTGLSRSPRPSWWSWYRWSVADRWWWVPV